MPRRWMVWCISPPAKAYQHLENHIHAHTHTHTHRHIDTFDSTTSVRLRNRAAAAAIATQARRQRNWTVCFIWKINGKTEHWLCIGESYFPSIWTIFTDMDYSVWFLIEIVNRSPSDGFKCSEILLILLMQYIPFFDNQIQFKRRKRIICHEFPLQKNIFRVGACVVLKIISRRLAFMVVFSSCIRCLLMNVCI